MEAAAKILPGGGGLKRRAAERYRDFHALQDVSFQVRKGEAAGIIGRNGSGKSTLLQLIAGTLQPTTGTVQVQGRVAALLELGSGFNPDFTGRENVYLNAAVLGLSRAQIDARFADIAAFADIGDFLEQPVSTYSSGMMLRLAFAVQTAVAPDILIVDEALAVGDAAFVAKCINWVANFIRQGGTLLFVSHDTGLVKQLTGRCLYLEQGRMVCYEQTPAAVAAYEARLAGQQLAAAADADSYAAPESPYRITAATLDGAEGRSTLPLRADLVLEVTLEVGVSAPGTLVFSIYNYLGLIVVSQVFELPAAPTGTRRLKVRLEFTRLRLAPGSYRVNFSVRRGADILSWKRSALNFVVEGSEIDTYIYREDAVARLNFD